MKGAVHLLEDGEKERLDEETSLPPPSPGKECDHASDARRRQLHAMVEHLRPEDTIKLVGNLHPCCKSVNMKHVIVLLATVF